MARWGDGADGLRFNGPNGIAIDAADHVYTTEFRGHRVRKFTPDGELLAEWGTEGGANGQFRAPTGIALGSDGAVYIAESGNHRVQKFTANGEWLATWGSRGSGPGEFLSAMLVAVDADGRVYVSDWGNSRVQVFDNDGRFLHQIAAPGTGTGEITNPTGVTIGPGGDLWVMDRGNSRIQRFTLDGAFVQLWTRAGEGVFKSPTNITFDKDGNWWVSEFAGHRVRQFSPDGELLFELAPGTFRGPHGLLFDSTGALYVADTGNGVVRKFRLSPPTTAAPSTTPTPIPAPPKGVNETNFPLTLPAGFRISLFTPKPIGPIRFMAFSPDGILFVSLPSRLGLYTGDRSGGTVFALPDRDQDGRADEVKTVIAGLGDLPHGLAFYDGYLYVAEEDSVSRYLYRGDGDVGPREVIVEDLTDGPGHVSRTIAFGGSDKMYVSIGSSCNVCEESDPRRATIMEYSPDGAGERLFANGLRNAVGFVFHPVTGEIWATENARDGLGDDIPPDEINIVRDGQQYGWPFCYGKRIPDPAFDDSARCSTTAESLHDLQAHSVPLGLRFIDSPLFPEEWQGDLLVAYHGSSNRSEPTGYKVVRMVVDGSKIVAEEDFIYGWLLDNGSSAGRPVDLIFGPDDGALYITDDKAGVVYRVTSVQ